MEMVRGMGRRVGGLLVTALAAAVVLGGCNAHREVRAPASAGGVAGSSGLGSQSRLATGNGIAGCEALDLATELPSEALVGSWRYLNSTWYYEGDNAYAYTTGSLVLTADGRWDGDRKADNASGVASGPGDWSFDGWTLTLSYDDGSFPETYDAVLLSDQVESDGTPFRALSLVIDWETEGCLVHLLASEA